MGAVSFQNVVLSSYDTAYYDDYHGWRDTLKYIDEAFNAFVANNDEAIVAVNFFTAEENVDFTVRIYDDFNGIELENELTSISGSYEYSGLHTVDLPDTVHILSGNNFYVFLSLSLGGFAYDRTSEVPVLLGASSRVIVPSTSSPEQSYFSDEGAWTDFYYYDDGSGYENTGNLCIKALAIHDPNTGISDVIKHGKTGYLSKNLVDFQEKAVKLLKDDDLRLEMGKNAKKVAESYRISTIAKTWIKLYKFLINELYPLRYYKKERKERVRLVKEFIHKLPTVSY